MTMRVPYVLLDRSDDLHLTATTTGANETVTITRMRMLRGSYINWGDGQVTNLPANSGSVITHVYASAGTHQVTVGYRRAISAIHLENGNVSGIDTRELAESPIIYLYLSTLRNIRRISSNDMKAWRPLFFILSYIYDGSLSINSADMINWRPFEWSLNYMAAGNYAIDTAHMLEWKTSIGKWSCCSQPAGNYVFAASCMRNWTSIQTVRCNGLALSQAQVDGIINDIYAGKATFTYATPSLNIGGNNAAPSGSYQSVCPPTSGLETVYDLSHGVCVPAGPEWTITYTGGTAP